MRMTRFWKLFRFQFQYKIGYTRLKHYIKTAPNGKLYAAGGILLALFAAAVLLAPYTFILYQLYQAAELAGNPSLYLKMVLIVGQVLVLLVGILSSFSMMFGSRDGAFLSALPFKQIHIFSAVYLTMYLMLLGSSLGVLLPGLVIYAVYNGVTAGFITGALIGTLLFPALPAAVGIFLVLLFTWIAGRFRHKELAAIICGISLVVLCMLLNTALSAKMGEADQMDVLAGFFSDQAGLLSGTTGFLVHMQLLENMLTGQGAVFAFSLFGYVLFALLLMLLVCAAGAKPYFAVTRRMSYSSGKKGSIKIQAQVSAPAAAFCKKEFRTILRSPVYAMNCLINVVFGPVVLLTAFFGMGNQEDVLSQMLGFFQNEQTTSFYLLMGIALLLTSMNLVPSTTFSREGRCFWLTQVIPVSALQQAKGRIRAALLSYYACGAIMVLLTGILMKTGIFAAVTALAAVLLGCLPFTYVNIFIDLIRPKLIWDREAEAVKQNMNGMLGMLASVILLLLYAAPALLYFGGILQGWTCIVITFAVILAALYFTRRILYRRLLHND